MERGSKICFALVTGNIDLARVHFFFQAEDGIRDVAVTGVQTCALPISREARLVAVSLIRELVVAPPTPPGTARCRDASAASGSRAGCTACKARGCAGAHQ